MAYAGAPVMVIGKAERLSTLEVVKYFHSRPRDSQIGAWCRSSPAVSRRAASLRVSSSSLSKSSSRAKFLCRASGADSESASSRWSSGRAASIVCTIVFSTSGKTAAGKSTDWRHKARKNVVLSAGASWPGALFYTLHFSSCIFVSRACLALSLT